MRWISLAILLSLSACYYQTPEANSVDPTDGPPSVKLIWPWDSSATYSKGEKVSMPEYTPGGPIYESLKDDNKGIQPPTRIVMDGDTAGPVGSQLPGYTPSSGWQDWWVLSSQTQ